MNVYFSIKSSQDKGKSCTAHHLIITVKNHCKNTAYENTLSSSCARYIKCIEEPNFSYDKFIFSCSAMKRDCFLDDSMYLEKFCQTLRIIA